jgi:hypothetical protein
MSPLVVWTVVALVIIPIIALSVYAVVDLARRDDVPAGRKAAWIAAVAFVPLLGAGSNNRCSASSATRTTPPARRTAPSSR